MPASLKSGQTLSFTVQPLKADGTVSTAKLSGLAFTSSDPTVFTVAPDPSTPNGGIITGTAATVGTFTATLTATATFTLADGTTTGTITGSDTVSVTDVAPPEVPPVSLGFTFGTPVG